MCGGVRHEPGEGQRVQAAAVLDRQVVRRTYQQRGEGRDVILLSRGKECMGVAEKLVHQQGTLWLTATGHGWKSFQESGAVRRPGPM
ncbi:hypothetical protein [Streptomyces umbrinus]|uniref:hypothetical protein n=1 Tax=Streptomyces umbrinus TaxID=67370 RepID=UPI0027D84A84|nr:hypothetical protein [Streptomyces umbrinus]